MAGWIKLHRSLERSAIASRPDYLAVWIHLLLKATHKHIECLVGRQIVALEPGQLVFGRATFSQKIGLSESVLRGALGVLERLGQITIKSTTKFSVISITKWDDYQQEQPANDQQMTSKQPTNDHKQEVKEFKEKSSLPSVEDEKPERKPRAKLAKTKIPDPFLVTGEMRHWAADRVPGVDLKLHTEKFVNYWRGEAKTKADWPATWRNWMLSEQEKIDKRPGGSYGMPINRQQQIEDENARVVREIAAREAMRRQQEHDHDGLELNDVVAIDGEIIHVD